MNPMVFVPSAPTVLDFDDATQAVFAKLWTQWAQKQPRNITRMLYMDAKQRFKDLEISLPPHLLQKLDIAFGWPEKAVYELANRIVLEDVQSADGDSDPFGLKSVLHANRFWIEFPEAVTSSIAQSVSFVSVTAGDTSRGEPAQLIMFHSALFATGLWDKRLRQMTAGLLINDVDGLGTPNRLTVMLPHVTYVCRDNGGGWFIESTIENRIGRLAFHRLPLRPNLDRPFGKSRIDRPTMSMTDRAVRAAGRLEVHSELFMMIKLMLMGAGENTFQDQSGNTIPLWSFMAGRVNGIPKDEDGDVPKLETIAAQSPQPHIDSLREIASEFSGHTGVPLSALGISSANPESADAKRVGREDIVNDAERQQLIYGDELLRCFEDVVMLRDGLTKPPPEMMDLSLTWRSPERVTLSALADAGSKQVAAVEGLAQTDVGMEMLGMSRSQRQRAQSQLRRAQSGMLLDRVLNANPGVPAEGETVIADGDAQ